MLDERRWLKWLLIAGCWTLVALMFASQSYVANNANGYPTPWAKPLTWALTEYWTWAALTPLILLAGRPFFIDRGNWRRPLAAHLLLGLCFAASHLLLMSAAEQLTTWAHHPGKRMSFQLSAWYYFTKKFHMAFLTYWVITGVSHAFEFYRRNRQNELRASRLEAQLSRAELHALRMQLHPHFLFNTLNTISALVHRDARAADRMVARLGDLLRLTLDNQGVEEVSLKEELEFLQKYLEIEQTRFHDRLTVELDVDPASLDARLPNLLLQPLVENAIKHGVSARPGAGRIEISARRENGTLSLRVRDDGDGLPAYSRPDCTRSGVGLANTRARLAQLYGAAQRFELANAEGGGCEVVISIPYHADGTEGADPPDDAGAAGGFNGSNGARPAGAGPDGARRPNGNGSRVE
jgi:two-component system, LytTR family, sensor kinase